MKKPLLFLILLTILPFTYASIEITSELKNEYSLGEDIDFSIKIISDKTTNALVKLTLKCTNKETLYYVTPIKLEEGKETSIDSISIKAFSEGLCNIRVNVESLDGSNIEGITSKEFTISDLLDLSVTADKTKVLPGDTIKIKGIASKGEKSIEDGEIVIKLDNLRWQKELKGKTFSHTIRLEDTIKSGEHTIIIEVSDSYENFNEKGIVIDVKVVPTKLEVSLNRNEFKPKENLKVTPILLDQAEDRIEDNVDIKLFKKKTLFKEEIVIFDTSTEANKEFDFSFDATVLPDNYILKTTFDDLEKEEIVTILPYPKIEMKLEGWIVHIKNTGNVEFNDETIIVLDKDNKTYIIEKKIKLDIGEGTTIDLSYEMPSGSYKVTLPKEDVEESTKKNKDKKETPNIIENVDIKDNRPLYKKGISSITGKFLFGAGFLLSKPGYGSGIMVIVILGIIIFFGRKKIKKVIENIRKKRSEQL